MDPAGWHVISARALLAALHRVADGDNPDVVYLELWANGDHEQVDP